MKNLPVITALAVMGIYLATLAPGYMPGESAFSLLQALPESMFPTFGHTLWHNLIRLLDALPFGSVGIKSGGLAAVTGALAAAFVTMLALRIPVGETPEEQRTPVSPIQTRKLIVFISLLTFVFSPPIWFASTRPLPQMFGLMCLLGVATWTLATFRKRSPGMLNVAALLWGWLVTEYATSWFFLGFFAMAVLLSGFDTDGRFRWGRNFRIIGLFLLSAVGGYLWMSVNVLRHPHAELQGISSLADALWTSLTVQKNLLTQAAPLQGSLLVFFLFGGPFLWMLWPKENGTLEVRIGSVMLHCTCAVINAVMLFHPAVSPWGLYLEGHLGVFMVAPTAMLALSTGYLCGYFRNMLAKYDPYLPFYLRAPRRVFRRISLPVMIAVLGVSTVLNLRSQRDPDLREVNDLARRMAEFLAPYETYIGESGFNDVLRLKLRDRGAGTRVIDLNPMLWQKEAYRKIIAAGFVEQPRLSSLAEIGPSPLVQAWAAKDPQFGTKVLLGELPDLLVRAGLNALPLPFGYAARTDISDADMDRAIREAAGLWTHIITRGEAVDEFETRNRHRAATALRTFYASESRRANNLGVLLESRGRLEAAREAYRSARALRPDNLSALLNLAHHLPALPPAEQTALQSEVETLITHLGARRHVQWRLAEVYGYVSHPIAHMQRGMAWVVSGKPNLAAREYEAALRQAPGTEILRLRLAQARLAGRDWEASEAEFLAILEGNPDSAPALLGLCRLYALRGNPREASVYLERLRDLNVASDVIFREETALLSLSGRTEEAAAKAEAWMKASPERLEPLLARMGVALDLQDRVTMETLRAKAETIRNPPAEGRIVMAQLLMAGGDVPAAKRWLRPLLEEGGFQPQAAEIALRIAVREKEREDAEKWVRVILENSPGDVFANYILGTLRHMQGRMREAESAFQASIRSQPSPDALNHLAALLLETGRNAEALGQIDEAQKLDARSPMLWDTRAEILLGLGRLEEAHHAQAEALAVAPQYPPFQLTMARILAARGQREQAREITEHLLANLNALTPAQQETLRKLTESVAR